jgi:tRNA G18 (ribose-2'-O)-methylase SpoU
LRQCGGTRGCAAHLRAEAARCPIHATDDERLTRLADTDRHQGVVRSSTRRRRVSPSAGLDSLTELALLLILDGVTDPPTWRVPAQRRRSARTR